MRKADYGCCDDSVHGSTHSISNWMHDPFAKGEGELRAINNNKAIMFRRCKLRSIGDSLLELNNGINSPQLRNEFEALVVYSELINGRFILIGTWRGGVFANCCVLWLTERCSSFPSRHLNKVQIQCVNESLLRDINSHGVSADIRTGHTL